jgi:hypothetical protein
MWTTLPAFGAASYVPAIVLERPLRERADGLYSVGAYLAAKMVEEVGLAFFSSLVFSCIVWFPLALQVRAAWRAARRVGYGWDLACLRFLPPRRISSRTVTLSRLSFLTRLVRALLARLLLHARDGHRPRLRGRRALAQPRRRQRGAAHARRDLPLLRGAPPPLGEHPRLVDLVWCAGAGAGLSRITTTPSSDTAARRFFVIRAVLITLHFFAPRSQALTLPPPPRPAAYMEVLRYAWGSLMVNQFSGDRNIDIIPGPDGQQYSVLSYWSLDGVSMWTWLGYEFIFVAGFTTIAYLALRLSSTGGAEAAVAPPRAAAAPRSFSTRPFFLRHRARPSASHSSAGALPHRTSPVSSPPRTSIIDVESCALQHRFLSAPPTVTRASAYSAVPVLPPAPPRQDSSQHPLSHARLRRRRRQLLDADRVAAARRRRARGREEHNRREVPRHRADVAHREAPDVG